MTRADVMKLFPDATEEQITNLLNQYNSDIKQKTEKAKDDSEKVKELQAKLDALNEQNMTDIEKANTERDKALNSVADLQKQIKAMQTKTSLAELGIIGEQAEKLINADGVLDFATLGQIISDREKSAVSNFEKQNMKDTPGKNGLPGGNGGEDKPEDVKNAESISFGGIAENAQQTRDFYK